MDRDNIRELYNITPIENVPSILKYGILSYNESKKVKHKSIAMKEIQERRKDKHIPDAGMLHDYANLYFDAHNPALCKLREHNNNICVLCINPDILDLNGVIISDRNAATVFARFDNVMKGLSQLSKELLFARYWTHKDDQFKESKHKALKCAEVLIPESVFPEYINQAYVANRIAERSFNKLGIDLPVSIKSDIFF